jgi:hypothetical protein
MNYKKMALTLSSALGARKLIQSIAGLQLNDVLGSIGLERRPGRAARFLPAIGLVTMSAVVGAATALLLAPSSGARLRARLSVGLEDAKYRVTDTIDQLEDSRAGDHAVS